MTLTPWPDPAALPADDVGPLLRAGLAAGALDLPLPGAGRTLERWTALAELSAADLVLGRLAEAHADAVAILAELGGAAPDGLWGVWAAEPPTARVEAVRTGDGWVLEGRKAWCSGALVLDAALVSAHADDGRRLFAVDVADVVPVPGTWAAVGMAASGSVAVDLDRVPARPVGGPGAYLDRPGFWHGGAGVAACWYGGALGAARVLRTAARDRALSPHALAHLGRRRAGHRAGGAPGRRRGRGRRRSWKARAPSSGQCGCGRASRPVRRRCSTASAVCSVRGPCAWTRCTPGGSPTCPSTCASRTPRLTSPGSASSP